MRLELTFELSKPELPKDNKRIWISYFKHILSNCNNGAFYEKFYKDTVKKDYSFSLILTKPEFIGEKIELGNTTVRMIFSASDMNQTGLIFFAAFIENKNKVFKLPDGNAMILKKISNEKERTIEETNVIFKTVIGGGFVVREHNRETNKDYFYTTDDENFVENAERVIKDQALNAGFKKYDVEKIKFTPLKFKTVLVKQYEIYVKANVGVFQLQATPEILTYFYQAGIGSKHSMGYGLLDIIA